MPFISDRHVEVHVCQPDIAGDPGAAFAANARDGMLEKQRGRRQHSKGSTRGTVITQHVELPMAHASARRERQGHAQAPQQQDASPHRAWAGQ